MFSALLNIVIPVFAVAGLGALYGRTAPWRILRTDRQIVSPAA